MRLSELERIIAQAKHQVAFASRASARDPEIAINGIRQFRAELKGTGIDRFQCDSCNDPVFCITSDSEVMNLPISVLNLSVRARNVIANLDERAEKIEDLINLGFVGLVSRRLCGMVTVWEIARKLNKHGVGLWGMKCQKC